jgi:hypothetical protein
MKKLLLILPLIFLMSCLASKQQSNKLEVNKIDEYTGNSVKKTYWQFLSKDRGYTYVRFRKVNNQYFLHFKAITGSVFAIDEGENLYFKFNDGSIMKLYNPEYDISSYGGGSVNIVGSELLGIYLIIPISKKELETFSSKQLTGIRMIGTEGYRQKKVRKDYAENLIRLATLILNPKDKKTRIE